MGILDDRERMVAQQIEARGVSDASVLAAMREVPREAFVPAHLASFAHDDLPLSIGHEQTISQPYIVALTASALNLSPDDRVLEVGAGSGYAAAVLGRLAREVYAIERIPALAQQASQRLRALGYDNVHVIEGDGTAGLPVHAPYDAIAVAAAAPYVPDALLAQLAPFGRLVIPVGAAHGAQELLRLTRMPDGRIHRESLAGVRFVPLIASQGWASHA